MPLNPDAVGSVSEPTEVSWTSKDTLLYAVSLGAGTNELQYTTENTKDVAQQVLPTYPVVIPGGTGAMRNIGTFNPAMLVHGTQSVTLHQPLPVEGSATVVGKVAAVNPHALYLDAVARQPRRQADHLLRGGFRIVGIDQQDHIVWQRVGKVLERGRLIVVSLDKRVRHRAENRDGVERSRQHRGATGKTGKITGSSCQKTGFGTMRTPEAEIDQ